MSIFSGAFKADPQRIRVTAEQNRLDGFAAIEQAQRQLELTVQQQRAGNQLARDQRRFNAELRAEKRQARAEQTAHLRNVGQTIGRRGLITGPILAPMVVAWVGQIGFATDTLHWPIAGALVFAASWELTTAFSGWMFHQARSAGDGGTLFRAATWLFASAAGAMNYWHALDGAAMNHPTPKAVSYGAMSLVGIALWELYSSLVHRQALRARGALPPARPKFGMARWLRFPRITLAAWSLAIRDGLSTTEVAWGKAIRSTEPVAVEAPVVAPPRRHVICAGTTGLLLLRRPTPLPRKRLSSSTRPAEAEGTRVLDLGDVLSGEHSPIVYFICNGDRVKIGTSQRLRDRIRRLCLRVDDLALVLHGNQDYERSLHSRFADSRIGDSEWFELSPELEEFIATGGAEAAASLPPVADAPTANTTPPVVASERQEPTVSVASDSSVTRAELAAPVASDNIAPAANPVDSSDEELAATSRQRQPRPVANRKRNARRSMTEWVELAGPIFHAEFKRLHRQPTGDEFAEAIRKAKLGTVSASTAKNIRTEILDREPVPSLNSLKDLS